MKILERIELRRAVNGEGHILTRDTWSLAYIYSATPFSDAYVLSYIRNKSQKVRVALYI